MKKSISLFFVIFVISFLLGIVSISASLCKGSDGYYYDCGNTNKFNYYNRWHKDYQEIRPVYYPTSRVYSRSIYMGLDSKENIYRKNYYNKPDYIWIPQNSYKERYNKVFRDGYNKGYNLGYEKGYYYGYHKGFKKGYDLGYDDGWNKRDKKLIFEPSYPEYLVHMGSYRDGY